MVMPNADVSRRGGRGLPARDDANVSDAERLLSMAAGAFLIGLGALRRDRAGVVVAAAGTGLAWRGATGRCPLYRSMNLSTADAAEGVVLRAEATISAPREVVYRCWTEFTRHPRFSSRVEQAESTGVGQVRWTFRIPLGHDLHWVTEVVQESPGERLVWRTVEESDIDHRGVAEFYDAPGGRGTELHLTVLVAPPMGPLGRVVGRLIRRLPKEWLETELLQFKQWVETHELATVEGQPSGGKGS